MKLIWLSHVLEKSTPLYGGTKDIDIQPQKSFSAGDSCNTSLLTLTSHTGTHVDAPYHFLSSGKTVDSYPPETWVFHAPTILDVPVEPGQLITPDNLPASSQVEKNIDLLLVRTGFEQYRTHDVYWQNGPGFGLALADYLTQRYPYLRAVGLDCISISNLQHREEGRAAHREFLGRGLLLFEDMTLAAIKDPLMLKAVIALPLRFTSGDGAPCTIIGIEK